MSADNWAECPQCKVNNDAKIAVMHQEVSQRYGKVSSEEYLNGLTEYNEFVASTRNQETTLREDYELGIYGFSLQIAYSAGCAVCGFTKSFKHEEEIHFEPHLTIEKAKTKRRTR